MSADEPISGLWAAPAAGPTERARVHRTKVGTTHPEPGGDVGWVEFDASTSGEAEGVTCAECEGCECDTCPECGRRFCQPVDEAGEVVEGAEPEAAGWCDAAHGIECFGLERGYLCLDGGDEVCFDCAPKVLEVVPCTCS